MHNTFPTIVRITPAVLKATGKTEATYADLVTALRLIEHATAPTPDDGGGHENAYSIAIDALHRVLDESLRGAPQEPPHGWVMVPREPTQAMWEAAKDEVYDGWGNIEPMWRVMLAAAPQPQAPSANSEK